VKIPDDPSLLPLALYHPFFTAVAQQLYCSISHVLTFARNIEFGLGLYLPRLLVDSMEHISLEEVQEFARTNAISRIMIGCPVFQSCTPYLVPPLVKGSRSVKKRQFQGNRTRRPPGSQHVRDTLGGDGWIDRMCSQKKTGKACNTSYSCQVSGDRLLLRPGCED
jgi:hypothetical protein